MPTKLNDEDEALIRHGSKLPCPECGNILEIKDDPTDSGAKSFTYRCAKDECQHIAGSILVPWHEVILNSFKKSTVAIALFFIISITGVITNSLTNYSTTSDAEQANWARIDKELEEQGCEYEEGSSKKDNEIISCIEDLLEQLKEHQEDEIWAEKHRERKLVAAYLKGKGVGLGRVSNIESRNSSGVNIADFAAAIVAGEGNGIREGEKILTQISITKGESDKKINSTSRGIRND